MPTQPEANNLGLVGVMCSALCPTPSACRPNSALASPVVDKQTTPVSNIFLNSCLSKPFRPEADSSAETTAAAPPPCYDLVSALIQALALAPSP